MNAPSFESLAALGQLAMRETGAAGYGLYRLDRESRSLVRLQTCGTPVFEFGTIPGLESAVSYVARVPGVDTHVLTFVFRSPTLPEEPVKCLELMTDLAERVLSLSLWPARYASLAEEAADIETQVVYAKVRDRARGLIRSDAPGGIETLGAFSEAILSRTETPAMLERLVADRREELRERSLTTQAKAVLESIYSMSEEQAHHHLRAMSRRNRRPLKDVALELIGKRS